MARMPAHTHTTKTGPLTGLTPGPAYYKVGFITHTLSSLTVHHSYSFPPKLQTSHHLPNMYLFSEKQNGRQRYTELIRNATGKWPNWVPAKNINVGIASPGLLLVHLTPPYNQAGDFGSFNERTGVFIAHGNIYTHDDISQIAEKYLRVQGDKTDVYQIESDGVEGLAMDASDES